MASRSAIFPPNGPLEVVFSFDSTCSMYSWLDELRGRIQDMIQRLQADIPGIKMAVFAHGDYDTPHHVTKWTDFTGDIAKLCKFVNAVKMTPGHTIPECYELVLRQVRTELSWTPGSRRVLVMIGDSFAHEPTEECNRDKIDWREEVKALAETAVTIYGVQCGSVVGADMFYKAISLATGGRHLLLDDFASLFDTLMAVCYREGNDTAMLASYEKEVRARYAGGGLAADIDAIFTSLRSDVVDISDPVTITPPTSVSPLSTGAKKRASKMATKHTAKLSQKATAKVVREKKPFSRRQTRTEKARFAKFREYNLPLLKRENVPENNFSLRSLRWSPWKLAMVGVGHPATDNNEMWEKRVGRPGYRLKVLPYPKSSSTPHVIRPALFEVAVQASGTHKKRYVVFSAVSSHGLGSRKWEPRLLGVASSQVDRVLNVEGSVHVRYAFLDTKALLESSRKNIRRYDYAWRKNRRLRSCPRDVVKGTLVISKSVL